MEVSLWHQKTGCGTGSAEPMGTGDSGLSESSQGYDS